MVVGISGVGKSTLINKFLNTNAPTGTGNFQTVSIEEYKNDKIPCLKLIDTRGIELNTKYGAEEIREDCSNYIKKKY